MLNQHISNATDNLKIALGDKVKVKLKDHKKNKNNQNVGTVLFYGHVESHSGTYYGISFNSAIGKNNGTYKKRKYFQCKKKHGCFVQLEQIIKIIPPANNNNNNNLRLYFNSTITLPEFGIGKICFAGLASFNPGIWYGIELNTPPSTYNNGMQMSPQTSKANGIVNGIEYFKCNEGHAIFRRQEDLYALLTGNKSPHEHIHIISQKNIIIKPSLIYKHHSSGGMCKDKYSKTPTTTKHIKNPQFKKSESAPYPDDNNTDIHSLPPLMDFLSDNNDMNNDEIHEYYNNDHSNETKEDEEEYDYPLKLTQLNPSDEMYDDNNNKNNSKPRKNTGIMIAESDTSDIDDNIVHIKNKKPKSVIIPHITIDDDNININGNTVRKNSMSVYLEHVQQQNKLPSPRCYTAPPKSSRKSIKKLKSQFKNACVETDNKYKNLCSTPVKFGQLSLEYSTSSPTEDIDNDAFIKPTKIRVSKSVPPNINIDNDDININTSQSARNSPNDRDRALTFPTMALNTDNASKVSAATPSEQTFKVVIIGQSRVGKTAIIRRFVKDKYISNYKMTINAIKSQFKCEVPIELCEHIEHDKNDMSLNLFGTIDEEENNYNMNNGNDIDPFDEQDKNAEFGAEITNDYITNNYDYNTSYTNEEYQLNNMDRSMSNNHLGVGLFDYQSNKSISDNNNNNNNNKHNNNKSITDYGSFTMPELNIKESSKNIRKVSMKLQITIDIIDMGFHATKEEIYNDVNAIILVIDSGKKSSISDAIDKYQTFLKHSLYVKSKKRKRKRSRSASNGNKDDIKNREYIPLIIAINKSDIKKNKKQFKKRDVKKIVYKRLLPIIDKHFPQSDTDDIDNDDEVKLEDTNTDNNKPQRKPRNFTNATWLEPPNLSFVYDESDKGSDSEFEDDTSDNDNDNTDDDKSSANDLLNININHQQQQSSPDDPFNTPQPKKRRKKSSKKMIYKKRDKSDIRYIDIVNCSAKTGKNIEQLFGTCIKKTIPSKLTKSVAHKRTKTTAHVTAPIWLRQVVAEFQNDDNNNHLINENSIEFGHTPSASMVDDNFTFLGDDDNTD